MTDALLRIQIANAQRIVDNVREGSTPNPEVMRIARELDEMRAELATRPGNALLERLQAHGARCIAAGAPIVMEIAP